MQRGQIIWGHAASPSGFRIVAFDGNPGVPFQPGQNAFDVSAGFSAETEAREAWAKLKVGGTVRQELGPMPRAALHGMLQDRFGVVWFLALRS